MSPVEDTAAHICPTAKSDIICLGGQVTPVANMGMTRGNMRPEGRWSCDASSKHGHGRWT